MIRHGSIVYRIGFSSPLSCPVPFTDQRHTGFVKNWGYPGTPFIRRICLISFHIIFSRFLRGNLSQGSPGSSMVLNAFVNGPFYGETEFFNWMLGLEKIWTRPPVLRDSFRMMKTLACSGFCGLNHSNDL